MSGNTVTLHRVFNAPAERIYRAFLDPDAMVKWFPPNGFTGKVQQLDASVGGEYKMSFTNLSNGTVHAFGGRYLELIQNELIVNTDIFDDPNLIGEMKTTVRFTQVGKLTEVNIVQEGIPEVIPVQDCYLGWQNSLALLGLLVEVEIQE